MQMHATAHPVSRSHTYLPIYLSFYLCIFVYIYIIYTYVLYMHSLQARMLNCTYAYICAGTFACVYISTYIYIYLQQRLCAYAHRSAHTNACFSHLQPSSCQLPVSHTVSLAVSLMAGLHCGSVSSYSCS